MSVKLTLLEVQMPTTSSAIRQSSPAPASHFGKDAHLVEGVGDDLIRLPVGLEAPIFGRLWRGCDGCPINGA
jgi:hypothetical protein